ncbi:MAG: MarR family winged helix-turn-helix transcriptional regulator, partial [Nocardioides sp.]
MTASRALVGLAVRSLNASSVELTLQQHRMLVILAAQGDQLVGSLADQMGVNASNASRLCDRLQKLELVARTRSTEDGRAVQVTLTDQGERALDAVSAMRRTEINHILERVPKNE